MNESINSCRESLIDSNLQLNDYVRVLGIPALCETRELGEGKSFYVEYELEINRVDNVDIIAAFIARL